MSYWVNSTVLNMLNFFFLRARDCIATKRENPLYKMQRHTLFTCSAPGWRPIMSKHRWPAAGEQVKRGPKNIQCWKEEREKRPTSTQAGLADPNKTKENLYIVKELKHAFPFKRCNVKNEPMIKSKWDRATLANQGPACHCFFVFISKTCWPWSKLCGLESQEKTCGWAPNDRQYTSLKE